MGVVYVPGALQEKLEPMCTRGVTVVLFIVILFCLHSVSVIAAVPMDVAFLMLGAALDLQASTGMLGKFTHISYPWPI